MGLSKFLSRHRPKISQGELRLIITLVQTNSCSLESKMASSSESTKLEHEGSFIEYAGSNKLEDKKVLVTGGEYVLALMEKLHYWNNIGEPSSGIGRSIAVFMAREGADISLVYLPKEQGDAEATKKMIEKDGRQCLLLPEDLRDRDFCHSSVEEHVKRWVPILLFSNAVK